MGVRHLEVLHNYVSQSLTLLAHIYVDNEYENMNMDVMSLI